VQGLDRERHAAGAGVRQDRGDALGDHVAGACYVLRALGQAADDEHETVGAQSHGLVDGAQVVVNGGRTTLSVGGREHAAAA
jgi:hypothetical protein